MKRLFSLQALLVAVLFAAAQGQYKVEFCGTDYRYEPGADSLTLYLKVTDAAGQKASLSISDLENFLDIKENNVRIPRDRRKISIDRGLPKDLTFSVLIDQGIYGPGKDQIRKVVEELVSEADSSVFISFFGDKVSSSNLATRQNFETFNPAFEWQADRKFFYSALYAKLKEFANDQNNDEALQRALADGYQVNPEIIRRAKQNPDKNILIIFADGRKGPDAEDEIRYIHFENYQKETAVGGPNVKVYALYYDSGSGLNDEVDLVLGGVTGKERTDMPQDRKGDYFSSADLQKILEKFHEAVSNQMYDYAFTYKVGDDKEFTGRVDYVASWEEEEVGNAQLSIGTPENAWPQRAGSWYDYLVALFVTFLTILFFFFVMKVLIPFVKSKSFSMKYYKKYQPEMHIQKRVCHYCKQPIMPGQLVVQKCQHVMHVACWQQNDYRCSEYGQNCKTGIQEHVDWKNLLTWSALKDCHLAIAGVFAGLVSWVIYELMGRGVFTSLAQSIVSNFLTGDEVVTLFKNVSEIKVSSFMFMGLLLGFFLSLIFRYNDEYRKKDANVYLKIFGLSLLTALIGMASFALGGVIFCMLASAFAESYVPWYCSLPAYLLFSVCTSLSLTIKSSIPVKSAMLGGLCSAVIGFFVLYFATTGKETLLNFIIYGGGLGASLVTVRMLAEKYFLVIMTGSKAGQRIPIHKWLNASGGANKVTIGMTGDCEIQMNWERSNKVAKEHVVLFIDHARSMPMIKPLDLNVIYNSRVELPVNKSAALSNNDTFKVGDTVFQYVETD